MLQIDTRHYASDALEDAMRLAQTKALNSYTFSDCLSFLNYAWRDIYDRIAMIDDGYYGMNMQITNKLTKIPPFVKNTLQIYSAQSPVGYDRYVFRESGTTDMTATFTYHLSGNELYCPDATHRKVWLYFVPACPQVFFTHHNRDPILYTEEQAPVVRNNKFNLYTLVGYNNDEEIDITSATRDNIKTINKFVMRHRNTMANVDDEDISEMLLAAPLNNSEDGEWNVVYVSCDFPYIFITYEHSITQEHLSGFFDAENQFNIYNPFAFTGRNSDVEYIQCKWNDKTGMGVYIKDYNDDERIKYLGWTPDTLLNYPIPEMYRYLVARLADKFSALKESNVMGVQRELVEAKFAFEAFLEKDKSAWKRITNVNPPNMGDWL